MAERHDHAQGMTGRKRTTIQFECPGYRAADLYCGMNGSVASKHAHAHPQIDHGHEQTTEGLDAQAGSMGAQKGLHRD